MVTIIVSWLVLGWLSLVFGLFGYDLIARSVQRSAAPALPKLDYVVLSGFLIISGLTAIATLFSPIGLGVQAFFLLAGAGLTYRHRSSLGAVWKQLGAGWRTTDLWVKLALGAVALMTIFVGISEIKWYDTGLYHTQSIRWIKEYAVVPGLGNLHGRFAYNSHFFIPNALFMAAIDDRYLLFPINSFFYLLLIVRLTHDVVAAARAKDRFAYVLKSLLLLLFAFHAVKEINSPNTDVITSVLVLYAFLLFGDTFTARGKEAEVATLWLIVVTAATYKLSSALLVLLLLFTLLRTDLRQLAAWAAIGLLVGGPFVYRNIVLSGYPLYPMAGLDLVDVEWKIPKATIVYDQKFIECAPRMPNYAKDGHLTMEEVEALLAMPFEEWFPIWWDDKGELVKLMLIVSLFGLIPLIFSLVRKDFTFAILLLTVYVNLAFWFMKAPDPRFAYSFLFLGCGLTLAYLYAYLLPTRALDGLLTPLVVLLPLLIIPYQIRKGKIHQQPWSASNLLIPMPYDTIETRIFQAGDLKIHVPVVEDQCFYHPLPCSPYPQANLELRGENLQQGFKLGPEKQTSQE